MGTPDWPRFLKYVLKLENGCWLWIGAIRGNGRNEYGAFWAAGGTRRAHIVAYVWAYGEPNADLHHTCENSLCVNPEHLVPASAGQPRHRNVIPGLFACGHEIIEENTYRDPKTGYRTCAICKARRAAITYANLTDEARDVLNAHRRATRKKVVHEPRPCEVCGTVFTPKREGSGRGFLCPKPPKTDVAAYALWRDCVNERQRLNRNKRLGKENS
jgi:hypothetical protein